MTIPRQTADTKISHPTPSDSASQVAIDDAHSNSGTTDSFAGDSSIALDVFEYPVLPPLEIAKLANLNLARNCSAAHNLSWEFAVRSEASLSFLRAFLIAN